MVVWVNSFVDGSQRNQIERISPHRNAPSARLLRPGNDLAMNGVRNFHTAEKQVRVMTTAKIVGIFNSRNSAQAAIHALFEHQYPREHISLLTPNMPAKAPTVPHTTAPTKRSQLHSTVAVVVETPEKIVPRTVELLQQHGAVEIETFKPRQQGVEQVDADAATRPEQAWEQSSKAGTVAGTAAGAATGAAIGAIGGPPGAAVGGLVGAAIGAGTGAAGDAIGNQAETAPQPTT